MNLYENLQFSGKILEVTDSAGRMRVQGRIQQADKKNANGRIYPRDVLEREVGRISKSIEARQVLGELDHPEDGKTKLHRVSHIWTQVAIDNNGEVTGIAEVLATPRGLILQELYKANIGIGASSRGQGSVKKSGEVQQDFKLDTFDMVFRPSTNGAYPTLMQEEEEEISTLKEDEESAHSKLNSLRSLVQEHMSNYRDLGRKDQIELGARLMSGEFIARRLVSTPSLSSLAEETLSLTRQMRRRVESELGINCNENGCELTTGSTVSVAHPTVTELPKNDRNSTPGGQRMSEQIAELQAKLDASEVANRKLIIQNEDLTSKLKTVETQISEVNEKLNTSQKNESAAKELFNKARLRIETLEIDQNEGLIKRLENAEALAEALAKTSAGQKTAFSEVLKKSETLGNELIARLAEEYNTRLEETKGRKAAELLCEAIRDRLKSNSIDEAIKELTKDDPDRDSIRGILESMDFDDVDELRSTHTKLTSIRREEDSTLPPTHTRKKVLREDTSRSNNTNSGLTKRQSEARHMSTLLDRRMGGSRL